MDSCVANKEALVLALRLEGLGFRPEDAAVLVSLWEAGGSKEDLKREAESLGYGPVPALEAALDDIRKREGSESD